MTPDVPPPYTLNRTTAVHENEPGIDGAQFGTRDDHDRLNPHLLLGLWRNCNPDSSGLHEIQIESKKPSDGKSGDTVLAMRIIAHGPDGLLDWGWQEGPLFASVEEGGVVGVASRFVYQFDFMTTEIQLRVNKGVLVPTLFTTFTDNSGRSSYFVREFFYRAE